MKTNHEVSDADPARQAQTLERALEAEHMQPLWDRFRGLLSLEPEHFPPRHWPWVRVAPLVDRAAAEVKMPEAERRVLLFTPPDFPGTIFTTPTLSAGLQILNPGESAPPHRHSVAALRLVMMGEGAETIVDGKVCVMAPGDLILTPAWTWHEHRHRGRDRMVWFDGLDLPLSRHVEAVFMEPHPSADAMAGLVTAPDATMSEGGVLPDQDVHEPGYSSLFRYEWRRVRQAIEAMAPRGDGARQVRYVNPADGGPVLPTIDCYALRLGEGPTTRARTTATTIAVVIEGEGETTVGGSSFAWSQHDVFTLPRWQWTQHQARRGPATLFLMTDHALLERMGQLRRQAAES